MAKLAWHPTHDRPVESYTAQSGQVRIGEIACFKGQWNWALTLSSGIQPQGVVASREAAQDCLTDAFDAWLGSAGLQTKDADRL